MSDNGQTVAQNDASDEELMSQLAAGQHEALGSLHGRYASLVYNLVARSLDRTAAEEIVQDVFVTVWRKADKFDPARGTFRSWVLRIAHLRALSELRRRGRRPLVERDPEGLHIGAVTEPGPGPDEAAWLDHRRAIVRAAVDALPLPQRQALRLAFLEHLSHQQIADFLELPLGTTKTRIRAGLQSLRIRLVPIIIAGLCLAGLLGFALVRDRLLTSTLRRDEAALRLVTSSDVVPKRLTATPGNAVETHGNYRGRPGVAMAVLTVSHLAPAPAGRVYYAWGMYSGRWRHLGSITRDARGSALLVAEGSELATPPTVVEITQEAAGPPTTPKGTPVIVWPGP